MSNLKEVKKSERERELEKLINDLLKRALERSMKTEKSCILQEENEV